MTRLLRRGVASAAVAFAVAAPDAVTAPPASHRAEVPSVRFAVKGDWGYGTPEQAAVTRRLCRDHVRQSFEFILTTGDNFYRPDGRATDANFRRLEACVTAAKIPWRPAWGNHDLGGSSTATTLGARRRYYTFRRGSLLRVIVLDGNRPSNRAQRAFLARTLSRAREKSIVVAVHQPVYTAGLHRPDATMQRLWAPLFRRFRVTMVLQGHNHHYERIRQGGVTYVTTGGGGAPLYPCLWPARGLKRCVPVHHFLRVTVSERLLEAAVVMPNGRVLETVRLRPARSRPL